MNACVHSDHGDVYGTVYGGNNHAGDEGDDICDGAYNIDVFYSNGGDTFSIRDDGELDGNIHRLCNV